MKVARIVAQVKAVPIYECSACKKQQLGDTMRLEFDTHSADRIAEGIKRARADSAHMPVGWSYNGKFTCPCVN